LRKLILFINLMAVIALALVYLSVHVKPGAFWPLAFPGLAYPLILIANLVFVIYWAIMQKRYFLISLVAILAGWGFLQSFVSLGNIFSNGQPEENQFKVLSYNVQVLGLYNYGPDWKLNTKNRDNIFRFLEEEDFDIICFQEFVHDKTKSFKTLDTLPTFLRAKNYHTGFTQESKDINFFGLAIFSAFPITGKGRIDFTSRMGNNCIWLDVKAGKDTIRVYNVHFESIGLSSEDFIFMENLTDPISNRKNIISGSLMLLQRMRTAFLYRTRQVETVAEHIKNCPYPVILAGDFNDTPASWSYRYLTRQLNDAFTSGTGTGFTHNGKIPGLRIDYILYSDHFRSRNFQTGKQLYSDHFPVWSTLNLRAPD
jgi:endonuclease/exonuclease/phosphatase family metal-dependent hydrolase